MPFYQGILQKSYLHSTNMKDFRWEFSIDTFDTDVKTTWNEGNRLLFYGGKPKISSNYLLLPQASEDESELEAGTGPLCQAACAGRLPTSTPQPSPPTQVRVPASACPWPEFSGVPGEEEAVTHSGGASFPAFLKGVQEQEPLWIHNN